MALEWTEQDARAVDVARILAVDAVEKVGNGHPGTPVSLAPVAYLLYQKVMNTDPGDEAWIGRDRFVLSAGHASLTQYTQLYLAGLGLEIDDLKALRTWGSKTPGHPEYRHTKFVECTTGPLGAGVSNAVGMAMAARRERGLFDAEAPAGESIFDRFVYAIAGDGCLQEGVSAEASSLAATQELGNLVLIYDDNRISIEGDTNISFSEDVAARYEAYGWHVQHVDWTNGGTEYREDIDALYAAIEAAKAVTDKPSFIKLTTVIGWPLPTKQGTHGIHGAKIGGEEIAAVKELLGFPAEPFAVDEAAVEHARANAASGVRRRVRPGMPSSRRGRRRILRVRSCWSGCVRASCRRICVFRCSRRARSRPVRLPVRCCPRWRISCRSCGVVRLIWRVRITPP